MHWTGSVELNAMAAKPFHEFIRDELESDSKMYFLAMFEQGEGPRSEIICDKPIKCMDQFPCRAVLGVLRYPAM